MKKLFLHLNNLVPKRKSIRFALLAFFIAAPIGIFFMVFYKPHEKDHAEGEEAKKFELTQLSSEKLQKSIYLTGQVLFIPGKSAQYSARTKGIVRQVHKNVGDLVSAGTPLVTVESNRGMVPFQVTSSLDGQVVARNVNIGEIVAEGDPLFEVADPKALWVELTANLRELPMIKIGQEVEILPFGDYKKSKGLVTYASPVVDEESGRGIVGVELSAEDRNWPAGLAVNARIVIEEVEVHKIAPKTAIFSSFGQDYMFVHEENEFIKRPVELGREDEAFVEVLKGIGKKEKFVQDISEIFKNEI